MKRKNIISIILASIISLFIVIGTSFITTNSFKLLSKNILITILSYFLLFIIIFEIIKMLIEIMDEKRDAEDKNDNKLNNLFNNYPFLFSFIFIILSWLIYIIAFYPAIMSPDPSYQILQYFNIDNKYSYYSILLDNSIIITNHHPVVHTIILGTCTKLGILLFKSVNIGLFIYTIIQTIFLASTLSYTIKFLKDINVCTKYRKICLYIYAFVPVFALYALSPVKDVIFGCLIIIYIISIYKFINLKNKINIKDIIMEILLLILIILFRNNGFHVILLSFPFLFLLGKKNLTRYIFIFLFMLTFYFSYNKVILPTLKITSGSIREMLSVPFQQTARYVRDHKSEISIDEKKAIDKILNYNTIDIRYNPKLADPVKNEFNKYYTDNDLKNYFKVWKKEFKKHPITYLEATIENTYGYFYPIETNWYVHTRGKKIINKYGFNYHFNNLSTLRNILKTISIIFPYIPFIGLFINIGFNTWILLFIFFYLIYKKKYKDIIYLIPSIILLMFCFISPANTYFRYALPNIFAMPVIFGMIKTSTNPLS